MDWGLNHEGEEFSALIERAHAVPGVLHRCHLVVGSLSVGLVVAVLALVTGPRSQLGVCDVG